MGAYVFAGCESLKRVELPCSVVEVPSRLFYNCTALEEVRLSKYTRSLGVQVFYGCTALKQLKLPTTVEKIGLGAFEKSGLEELHCKASVPPAVSKSFGYRGKVVVPHREMAAYKEATAWKECVFDD